MVLFDRPTIGAICLVVLPVLCSASNVSSSTVSLLLCTGIIGARCCLFVGVYALSACAVRLVVMWYLCYLFRYASRREHFKVLSILFISRTKFNSFL